MNKFLNISIIILLFTGCAYPQPPKTNVMLNEKLITIAKSEVTPKEIGNRQPQVYDRGNYWEVAFVLPQPQDGTFIIGGGINVWIEKKTLKVIQIYYTQ